MPASNAESEDDNEVFFDAQVSLTHTRRRGSLSAPKTAKLNDAFPTSNAANSSAIATKKQRSRSLPRRDSRGRSLSSSPSAATASAATGKTALLTSSSAVPAVPAIPARFVVSSLSRPLSSPRPSPLASSNPLTAPPPPLASTPRQPSRSPSLPRPVSLRNLPGSWDHADDVDSDTPATLADPNRDLLLAPEESRPRSSSASSDSPTSHQSYYQDVHTLSQLERRAPPPAQISTTTMSTRAARSRLQRDHFVDLADDQMDQEDTLSRLRRSESRFSTASKRRSLPADVLTPQSDVRPSTSGSSYARSFSRLHANNRASTDLQRHMDQYRSPTDRASLQFDSVSVSGRSASGRSRRFSAAPERSPVSPSIRVRSPEISPYVRGRQSLSVIASSQQQGLSHNRTLDSHEEESPAESSEAKHTDSASVESQTADTVWDELDDLKLRIKQLELTGKTPATSSAAASGDSSDRPRTATTAPTTIDSSPKHERKKDADLQEAPAPQPDNGAAGNSSIAKIHQPLHAALAKAKPLLDGSLFTTLEATVTDALQLVAMAGVQGTPTGIVSDRPVRRKMDTMCRNLTDLCLALCEGKHEAPALLSSPTPLDNPQQNSPSLRYSSSNLSQRIASAGRPMSRLEARRSSILGVPYTGSVESTSPPGSYGEPSTLDQDSPSTQYPPLRRISRAPSNLLRSRMQQPDDVSGDDEPTLRPPSRAMTDIGALRKARSQIDDRSPGPQRTPSLRESLGSRLVNEGAFDSNRDTFRTTSYGADTRRRRLYDQTQSTPPVVEEEASSDYQPASEPPRRHFSRHSPGNFPSRTASLNQRRQFLVE